MMHYISTLSTGEMAVVLLLALIPMLPNLWAIRHAMLHTFASPQEKMIWLGAAVFVPIIGGLAYVFFGRLRVTGKMF